MRETFGRMIYSVNGVFRYSCEYFQFATLSPNGTLCDLLQCTSNKGLTGEERILFNTDRNERETDCSSYTSHEQGNRHYSLEVGAASS